MFEQATIKARDEQGYAQLNALIEAAFDTQNVEVVLHSTAKAKLSIRDFEDVLGRGILGKEAGALYEALPVFDQGLTRERYLRLVETAPQELRRRYFRVYAYY
jgi:hypothetical protein